MVYDTIISSSEVLRHLNDVDWKIVDCRYRLNDRDIAERWYQKEHISGAVYADLEEDLSGEIIKGFTGRHPLPRPDVFIKKLGEWGIDRATQVVVYDDMNGAFAARLWWMLRWVGNESVAILDGGWQAWLISGFPTRGGIETVSPRNYIPVLRPELLITTDQMEQTVFNSAYMICDARESQRYSGENEPIDPVAGHIPGAISLPFNLNFTSQGLVKDPAELHRMYAERLPGSDKRKIVMYCGSGVTAALNVIMMKYAGLGDAILYVGSWSEWISDPNRPIEIGAHRQNSDPGEYSNE